MNLKTWREVLDCDFPAAEEITSDTVNLTKNESHRFRGSVRVSTGRIWTDKDYAEHRKRILETPLP